MPIAHPSQHGGQPYHHTAGSNTRVHADGETAAGTGQAFHTEFRIIRPGGEVRWCVAGGAANRDVSGAPVRLSGMIHDITERKRAEESLQHRNEVLERLVEEHTRERGTIVPFRGSGVPVRSRSPARRKPWDASRERAILT